MISQFIWFDLDDPSNRDDMVYDKFEFTNPYWHNSYNSTYILNNSGYCGALFLGVL
jgi:hypothetical protein